MSTANVAWTAPSTNLADRFTRRLKQIANQVSAIIMNTTRWGDKPYRWDRL